MFRSSNRKRNFQYKNKSTFRNTYKVNANAKIPFSKVEKHYLNNVWTIYAHDKQDDDFSKNSYKQVMIIETIEDFWLFFNNINEFTRHQFYIMRKKIPPIYECPENIEGGGISFMIQKSAQIKDVLVQLTIRMISERLCDPAVHHKVTGLYMNPKAEGANIKIWVDDYEWLKRNAHNFQFQQINGLRSKRITAHNVNLNKSKKQKLLQEKNE